MQVFKCDVSSTASARACAEAILREHRVDVLIDNAGASFDEVAVEILREAR